MIRARRFGLAVAAALVVVFAVVVAQSPDPRVAQILAIRDSLPALPAAVKSLLTQAADGIPPLPPPLTMVCPPNQSVTGPAGTLVTYLAPTTAGGAPPVSVVSIPISGSAFALGVTTVTATATDAAAQTATCSFSVTLTAPPPPPPTVSLVVTPALVAPSGTATVTWTNIPNAAATDWLAFYVRGLPNGQNVSLGWRYVSGTQQPAGSPLPNGTFGWPMPSSVSGPLEMRYYHDGPFPWPTIATALFDVGTVPPPPPQPAGLAITCPANQAVTGPAGTAVTWPAATATGGVAPRTITYAPVNGSAFPLGTTLVTATAIDSVSTSVSCFFNVTLTAAPPPPPPGSHVVLQQSDFTFLGGFKLPSPGPSGGDTSWGRGLAFRTVGGVGRIGMVSTGDNYEEYAIPATLGQTNATFPNAVAVKGWGHVFSAKYTVQYGLNSGFVQGIYWDPIDSRLYWNYGDTYKANTNPDPSIGYTTLNDAAGTFVSVDSWQVGANSKMTMTGTLAIPDWWSAQHTPGKRLAAGMGGYQSIVATGPASMGLALFAFNPATLTTTPSHGMVPSTPMVNYPFQGGCAQRMQRDPNYSNEFDACQPSGGIGYYNWVDALFGAVWIDTPTKTGVLLPHIVGNGRLYYQTSTGHATSGSHWFRVYDPADLADVVHGVKQPWQIQPKNVWSVQFPAQFTYPLPSWQDEPTYFIGGVAWDPVGSRLYVAVRFAYGPTPNTLTSNNRMVIYVFQVN